MLKFFFLNSLFWLTELREKSENEWCIREKIYIYFIALCVSLVVLLLLLLLPLLLLSMYICYMWIVFSPFFILFCSTIQFFNRHTIQTEKKITQRFTQVSLSVLWATKRVTFHCLRRLLIFFYFFNSTTHLLSSSSTSSNHFLQPVWWWLVLNDRVTSPSDEFRKERNYPVGISVNSGTSLVVISVYIA